MSRAFIHSIADVQTNEVGEGTRIWQYAVILPGAKIGRNCNICSHCFIENQVVIGDNVTIKNGVYLFDGTVIEDNVFIGHNVVFTNDRYPKSKHKLSFYPTITLKNGASVGAGSILLPGVTVGENSIIGAGTLVTKDVRSNTIVKNSRKLSEFQYNKNF